MSSAEFIRASAAHPSPRMKSKTPARRPHGPGCHLFRLRRSFSREQDANAPSANAGFGTVTMGGGGPGRQRDSAGWRPDIAPGNHGAAPGVLPPPDSVAEVKTEIFNMDAASGGAGGGSTEMITKGGPTTAWRTLGIQQQFRSASHGLLVNSIGGTKPSRSQPMGRRGWRSDLDPQGFQRKNRLFFLFAYEAYIPAAPPHCLARRRRGGKAGGFLAPPLLNNSTKNYTLYDPNTGVLPEARSLVRRFQTISSAERLNPIAQNFVSSYMPLPNRTGVYDDTQNYGANEVAQNPYHFLSGRGISTSAPATSSPWSDGSPCTNSITAPFSTISPTRTTLVPRELGGMVTH